MRGHVRKRSEGSSFRGFDDTTRRPGFSREENSKWLIEEYGKVRPSACALVFASGSRSLRGSMRTSCFHEKTPRYLYGIVVKIDSEAPGITSFKHARSFFLSSFLLYRYFVPLSTLPSIMKIRRVILVIPFHWLNNIVRVQVHPPNLHFMSFYSPFIADVSINPLCFITFSRQVLSEQQQESSQAQSQSRTRAPSERHSAQRDADSAGKHSFLCFSSPW